MPAGGEVQEGARGSRWGQGVSMLQHAPDPICPLSRECLDAIVDTMSPFQAKQKLDFLNQPACGALGRDAV
jgi:hypothetical protein